MEEVVSEVIQLMPCYSPFRNSQPFCLQPLKKMPVTVNSSANREPFVSQQGNAMFSTGKRNVPNRGTNKPSLTNELILPGRNVAFALSLSKPYQNRISSVANPSGGTSARTCYGEGTDQIWLRYGSGPILLSASLEDVQLFEL